MTYDQWKTTNPRDYEPEDEEEQTEAERLYVELHDAHAEARKYREALLQLFAVVKALACPDGISTAMLRAYLKTHPACRQAADVLGTDRLNDQTF